MNTKVIKPSTDWSLLDYPIKLLKENEVVAIPTETVYGLAANALSSEAVRKIFVAKKRPMDNPLIVHISSYEMLNRIVREIPKAYIPLMNAFWPGPITFLFPRADCIPIEVTSGRDTVAVRFPMHPIAKFLIEKSDCPLAAPSANLSGRSSPTSADHVFHDLNGRIGCIVDGGPCSNGLESTVVSLLSDPPVILRPGNITLEMLKKYTPDIALYNPQLEKRFITRICPSKPIPHPESDGNFWSPPAPGMKYVHYCPNAKLFLLDHKFGNTSNENMLEDILSKAVEWSSNNGIKGSVILPPRLLPAFHINNGCVESFLIHRFSGNRLQVVAQELFSSMRLLDSKNVDFMMMVSVEENDEGAAIMNRVSMASSATIKSTEEALETLKLTFSDDKHNNIN